MKPKTLNDNEYADLIVPMVGCCYGKPVYTCPFRKYWQYKSLEEKIELLRQMQPDELRHLRHSHRQCVRLKSMMISLLKDEGLPLIEE